MLPILESLQNRPHHALQIVQHLVVPKPQHPVSPRLQKRRPLPIVVHLLQVLPAVHLDDQLLARGAKSTT